MELHFHKYQGAGNDFILCDNRDGKLLKVLDRAAIAHLCDRHFGVGADGLMLLGLADSDFDFDMDYYNADGGRSTLCGNGGRCIVRFAADLGIRRDIYRFLAVDGPHAATITPAGSVALSMQDVLGAQEHEGNLILNTGSPHYLRFVDSLETIDVLKEGRAIRQSPAFRAEGINVNFVRETPTGLELATYERGVENETLACGTGVTAAVIGSLLRNARPVDGAFNIGVRAKGGDLAVTGERHGAHFRHLQLIGPAVRVFSGQITL